ncbi:hypothetical protein ACIP9H_01175 [Streptomyces sp. NPDC088732]|uniref:hypothetical protein n=1 Tax=Streptomyces sp. NPDC088732 TaxID=3365879 RepID=UPI00380B31E6
MEAPDRAGIARALILSNRIGDYLSVGFRRWASSNFLVPERATSSGGILVELHHDGWVVVGVDLSANLPTPGYGLPVDANNLRLVVDEAVVLADTHRLHRSADAPIEMAATVLATETNRRLVPFDLDFGRMKQVEETRHPKKLRPASSVLAPNAGDAALRACAYELNSGLLHQFGMEVRR